MKRRQFLRISITGSTAAIFGASPLVAMSEAFGAEPTSEKMRGELARCLRQIGTARCIQKAADLEALPINTGKFDLHLRDADIDSVGAQIIADAFRAAPKDELEMLVSFSLSFNTAIGDDGTRALAAALPPTLRILGLVGCNIGDIGGNSLLEWAAKADGLNMICIEGNDFSAAFKNEFRNLSNVSVYI